MKASTFVTMAAMAFTLGVGGCAVQTSTGEGESGEAAVVSPSVLGIRDPQATGTSKDSEANPGDSTRPGSLTFKGGHLGEPEPNPWIPNATTGGGGGGGGSGGVGGNGAGAPGGGVERIPDGF